MSSVGCPIRAPQASERIGHQLRGPLLLQDINLVDIISHVTRERIPERRVSFPLEYNMQ